ncbi:MAG: hypothetical protein V1722_05450 [Candidatus Micrarchaeota archaeon]
MEKTLEQIAREAWVLKPGVVVNLPNCTVMRIKHMVLIAQGEHYSTSLSEVKAALMRKSDYPWRDVIKFVAYPDPKHAEEFKKAVRGVRNAGPVDRNPGAIGTAALTIVHGEKIQGALAFVQAHYKTNGNQPLPRKLATRYNGWRHHCLDQIMALVKETRATVSIGNDVVYPLGRTVNRSDTHKALEYACKRNGFRLTDKGTGTFRVSPERTARE